MKLDQGQVNYPQISNEFSSAIQLDELPYDYFYTTDYNYLTLPEVQLLVILSDSQVSYSFSGLRKKTELHQHQLNKALKRLIDKKLLFKKLNGTYELTHSGSKKTRELLRVLVSNNKLKTRIVDYSSYRRKFILHPPSNQDILIDIFEKRWFGAYRFLFSKRNDESVELCWEDNQNSTLHIFIKKDGNIDLQLKYERDASSEVKQISKWIIQQINNHTESEVEVENIDGKLNDIPYN
ncbi:MAG: hypothetical protein ACTSSG_14820 [Candidatus Heimdallarchaeaceae archaeon]